MCFTTAVVILDKIKGSKQGSNVDYEMEVASIYPAIEPIDATSFAVFRSHVWLRKALNKPEGKTVDCSTTA